jgi:predicted RNA-binding protein with PIN domain
MHIDSCLEQEKTPYEVTLNKRNFHIDDKELQAIMDREFGVDKHPYYRYSHHKTPARPVSSEYNPVIRKQYVIVDGYNVIFAWDELSKLAKDNLESARDKLLDIMCNYTAFKKCETIVVFDAYKVKGHKEEYLDYKNIHVVYTAEAQTADRYIERFAHQNASKYNITVVTSDGAEQIIVMGSGCNLFSSREFEKEVKRLSENNMSQFDSMKKENATTSISEIIEKNIDIYYSKCNNSND